MEREICPECGDPIRGKGVYAGPYWNRRHYCSNSCCRSGERNLSQENVKEDNRGCLYRFFRFIIRSIIVIVGVFIFIIIESKLESPEKTEQTTTQTPKKQSTTTAKSTSSSTASSKPASSKTTTTGSSKPATTQSSNSQSSSDSGSKTHSAAQTNTAATSASVATTKSTATESDASYQTYLALSTLLESEGKSLKLCEAQNQTKGREANVIGKMSQLNGTKYYGNALKDLVRYCPKYANEYSKNGKYFASEAEFYQAYIAPDYSKKLKAKKKER
jgi:hypothetical protein